MLADHPTFSCPHHMCSLEGEERPASTSWSSCPGIGPAPTHNSQDTASLPEPLFILGLGISPQLHLNSLEGEKSVCVDHPSCSMQTSQVRFFRLHLSLLRQPQPQLCARWVVQSVTCAVSKDTISGVSAPSKSAERPRSLQEHGGSSVAPFVID